MRWRDDPDTLALTAPGAPFELVPDDVLGEPMLVFRNRPSSARELLADSTRHGDATYVTVGEQRLSFAEHLELAAAAAALLRDEFGVRPGDRVALLAANRAEWIVMFWAVVSSGAVVASMNSYWSPAEVAAALADCEPKVVFADAERQALLPADAPPVLDAEHLYERLAPYRGAALPSDPIGEDDPAVILYTSGTTGRSKAAVASHRSICGTVSVARFSGARGVAAAARAGVAAASIGTKQTALVTLPLFHASGMYGFVVVQLASGGSIVLRPGRFDPDDVIGVIDAERVTLWAALGSAAPRVAARVAELRAAGTPPDLSSVALLAVGGAPVSDTVLDRLRATFPNASLNVSQGYTSSEAVAVVTRIQGDELRQHPRSVGSPLITTEVEIRDEHGAPVPDGVTGEIHVRSPWLMSEYWRAPEATAQVLKPGRWLAMGDIGHVADGRLFIDSRVNDMILVNAENVYPAEIEIRLDAHPDVVESAVVGVPDDLTGEAAAAAVVVRPGSTPTPDELVAWCRSTMPAYKVPTRWDVRAEPLPRNASGKVLKRELGSDGFASD